MLTESCDIGENCFQIIARSMPYSENDLQLRIKISGIVGKPRRD